MESSSRSSTAPKGAIADLAAASRQLQRQAVARSRRGLTHLELFELLAGILVSLSAYTLSRSQIVVPGWHLSFPVEDALVAHFAGVPAFLAVGWAAMALRGLYARKWLLGAACLGLCSVAISALMLATRSMGLETNAALVLGLTEATIAGFWALDLAGHLAHNRILPAIALEVWVLMVAVLFFTPVLPYLFPGLVALLLTIPLLSASISRKLDVPSEKATIAFVAMGFFSAPLVVAAAMEIAHVWLPL